MLLSLRQHPAVTVTVIILIALLVWGFWPQPVLVEVASVSRGPLTISVKEEGRTRVIDRYILSAPVDGVTCTMQLKVGDSVKQGEVLIRIKPLESQVLDPRSRAQAEQKVEAARSALEAAREQASSAAAAQQLAVMEEKRLRPLLEKRLVARERYDRAATTARTASATKRSADFQVDVALHNFQAAQAVLQYTAGVHTEELERVPVTSPVDGRILKVVRECEGPVRTGEALLEVGDPALLEIEVDVLSADAVKIKPGMKVLFDRWGGEESLEGVVRIVEPVGFTKTSALGVEEQRVLIISNFTSAPEKWQRLGDGYRVEARFILWHDSDVLQVPASSLFRYQGGWAVFVLEDKHAVYRSVSVGKRNGLQAQVIDGLVEGEQVINHPGDNVEEGVRVKLVR